MARYIDANRLIEILLDREGKSKGICGDLGGAVMGCIRLVEATPAADVVPKREVFLASSDAMKMLIECHGYALTHDADIKEEVAREIFEDIENNYADFLFDGHRNIVVITEKDFEELKKKYTE